MHKTFHVSPLWVIRRNSSILFRMFVLYYMILLLYQFWAVELIITCDAIGLWTDWDHYGNKFILVYISCVWLEFCCIADNESPSSHRCIWFFVCQMLCNTHLTRPNKIFFGLATIRVLLANFTCYQLVTEKVMPIYTNCESILIVLR